MLRERAIEQQQELFLCFTDYVKAFDKVRHEKFFDLRQSLDVDGKDLELVRNLYWNRKAAGKVDDQLTDGVDIAQGVHHGCVQSPNYFNSYSDMIDSPLVTSDARCRKEIKNRIDVSKEKFGEMRSIITNRLLKCYIWSILTYDCETWTLSAELIKNISAAEIWFLCRILRVSYVDRVTNEDVLLRTGVERKLLSTITGRQFRYLGHIIRKGNLEISAIKGKIEGKKSKG
ncbi:uncharacterized protein [Penaeus vannamei]|uniref:uncharacterized protein n=1 Tax=Penaeus vannamei TaxID=6689 RepID=UPI00387FA70E